MSQFRDFSNSIAAGRTLSFEEARVFQTLILKNEFEQADLIVCFKAWEKRPLTFDELKGFYEASKEAMLTVETEYETLDNCGTGGDQSGTFNISTAAAIIAAAAGVPVTKHGNRAASSRCGSADVLEALRVNIDLTPQQANECLRACGFVFLLAKNFHPAFRFAAAARRAYGARTYFNILGPLLNPALAQYRVHGFADISQMDSLGRILLESGIRRAWLIHSYDGLDEISPAAPTRVLELRQGQAPRSIEIQPADYGFKNLNISDLKGGDAQTNAAIITAVLRGKANQAQMAATILNAAAGLAVYGTAQNLTQGVEMAKAVIDSGKAYDKLLQIQSLCPRAGNAAG